MKITVTEALRLKGEISNSIRILQTVRPLYGIVKQDSEEVDKKENVIKFPDYIEVLNKAFIISEQINSILSTFNVSSGISDKVRHKANLQVLHISLQTACGQTKTTQVRYETVGEKRIPIVTTFEPFVSKKELRVQIKTILSEIRKIQSEIDLANTQIIELPFEYEDVENISVIQEE